ncbi:MAG: glycosyltransferase family 4 protein [Woeseiaceae bacterium]
MRIVVLSKRQYTNKDVIDDRYGRLWEIPMALASQGHSVTCICLSYRKRREGSETYQAAGGHSIRWLSVNLGTLGIFGFVRYFLLARKTIRAESPDVIWSASDTIYTTLGQYFSRKFSCRHVADLYDNFEYFGSYRLPVLKSLYRKAVRDADGVSCVSRALSNHLRDSYDRSQTTSVVTNAVDTAAFRPMDKTACRERLGLPSDALLVGAAGDISNYRGADMLYRAFVECSDELDGVQLVVAGHRTKDTTIPTEPNIRDFGMLAASEVPILLNSLDVVVIYNRSSTFGDYCFPQKFYEALACEVPPVVANVGELGLLLEDWRQLHYQDGDAEGLVQVLRRQLEKRETIDLDVPTWADQAQKLQQLMQSVLRND